MTSKGRFDSNKALVLITHPLYLNEPNHFCSTHYIFALKNCLCSQRIMHVTLIQHSSCRPYTARVHAMFDIKCAQ